MTIATGITTKPEVATVVAPVPPPTAPVPPTAVPPPPMPPTVPLIIQINNAPTLYTFRAKLSRQLGVTQIIGGILGIVINSLGLWIHAYMSAKYTDGSIYHWETSRGYYMAPGFWGAVFFFLTGSFAICAAKTRSPSKVYTLMVVSSYGSVCGCFMLGMSLSALVQDSVRIVDLEEDDNNYMFTEEIYLSAVGSVVLSVFFVLVAIVEFVACVWVFTLTYRAGCRSLPRTSRAPLLTSVIGSSAQNNIIVMDIHGRVIPQDQVVQMLASDSNAALLSQAGILPGNCGAANSVHPPPYE